MACSLRIAFQMNSHNNSSFVESAFVYPKSLMLFGIFCDSFLINENESEQGLAKYSFSKKRGKI